jgi:hypothetical protein
MYVNASGQLSQWDGTGLQSTTNAIVIGAITKGATTSGAGNGTICLNGSAFAPTPFPTGYPLLTNGVDFLRTNEGGATQMGAGYIRRITYWPRILTNAEMQTVTT